MKSLDKLPEGAVQVHFGTPRSYIGLMIGEEIEHIQERYHWLRQSWTDQKYGDAITREEFDALWKELWTEMTEGFAEGWV